MLDIAKLLLMPFFFCGFCVEFILRQKCIDELPVGTIRHINSTDSTDFFEIVLRIEKFFLCSYIVEVSILDDFFEMAFWFREEYCCHDNSFDFLDTFFIMSLFLEPFSCDTGTEVFIFFILYSKACIMKECSYLEIFEIFSLDSLRHSKIGSTREYTFGVMRIVIGIVSTFFQKSVSICFCFFDERHKKIG